jgi:hypothetical protein
VPLNELKNVSLDVYQREKAKYEGRERVMNITIPRLDTAWNDVLHLSPIHPSELKNAFVEEGGNPDDFPSDWYKIPITLIAPESAVLSRGGDFLVYDPETLINETHVPEATRGHYRESIAAGKRTFFFEHAPHLLFKGSIPLAECSKIKV